VSYGFVRDRTVEKAISRVKNLRTKFQWAYKADISSFFDSLERRVLDGLIPKTVKSQAIRKLLSQVCRCEIANTYASAEKAIGKMGIKRGCADLSQARLKLQVANIDHKSGGVVRLKGRESETRG
jgi:hypothetical protein